MQRQVASTRISQVVIRRDRWAIIRLQTRVNTARVTIIGLVAVELLLTSKWHLDQVRCRMVRLNTTKLCPSENKHRWVFKICKSKMQVSNKRCWDQWTWSTEDKAPTITSSRNWTTTCVSATLQPLQTQAAKARDKTSCSSSSFSSSHNSSYLAQATWIKFHKIWIKCSTSWTANNSRAFSISSGCPSMLFRMIRTSWRHSRVNWLRWTTSELYSGCHWASSSWLNFESVRPYH